MKAPKRLSVKLFVDNPEVVEAEQLVPVFQRWIQETAIENELLIDVADYKHVPHGPGILLVAHEGDYAYQANEGRIGLSYTLKQHSSISLFDALSIALRRVIFAAQLIHSEETLHEISINLNTVQVTLLDRLNYPNDTGTQDSVSEELEGSLSQVVDDINVITIDENDLRNPLQYELHTQSSWEGLQLPTKV